MIGFKQWFSESKGIRVTDELEQQIDALYPKVHQAALQSKQSGEDIEVGDATFSDQYFKGRPRQVNIQVINDPSMDFHGDFNPVMGVRINVAHTEPQNITPKWARRLLVHELGIHAQDPKIADFQTFAKMDRNYVQAGEVGHYTQDMEFDAYTGQIVDSLIKAAKMNRGQPQAGQIAKLFDDTLEFIRSPDAAKARQVYGIIADPEYWKSFHIYYQHSTPQQKKRLFQRIYKAVQDAKAILGPVQQGFVYNP